VALKSVLHGGRDITDQPTEFAAGGPPLQVLLTRGGASLTGIVRTSAGVAAEASLLLFSEDPALWHERASTTGITSTGDGRFRLDGLRAGRYLGVATHLRFLSESSIPRPEFANPASAPGTKPQRVQRFRGAKVQGTKVQTLKLGAMRDDRMKSRYLTIAALVALSTLAAAAQEKPAPSSQPTEPKPPVSGTVQPGTALIPLKVTVLLSRFKEDKKISSLPYVLGVTTNAKQTTLRMGAQVPVAATMFGASDGGKTPITSYNYRDFGTNIDCHATGLSGGLYQLAITVSDTSAHVDSALKGSAGAASLIARDVPIFRTFNSSFTIVLRDGQTTQYTSATDPVTGEVMKIDVTLNVWK
jgi:hypothetical protein